MQLLDINSSVVCVSPCCRIHSSTFGVRCILCLAVCDSRLTSFLFTRRMKKRHGHQWLCVLDVDGWKERVTHPHIPGSTYSYMLVCWYLERVPSWTKYTTRLIIVIRYVY